MIELFTQITYKLSELFISLSRNLYTLPLHVTFVLGGYILYAHCCGAFLGSQRVESFEKFFQNKWVPLHLLIERVIASWWILQRLGLVQVAERWLHWGVGVKSPIRCGKSRDLPYLLSAFTTGFSWQTSYSSHCLSSGLFLSLEFLLCLLSVTVGTLHDAWLINRGLSIKIAVLASGRS